MRACRYATTIYPSSTSTSNGSTTSSSSSSSSSSSASSPRRSSRARRPAAGGKKEAATTPSAAVQAMTRQVAPRDLERSLRGLVGTKFEKDFPGHGKYRGRITKYLSTKSEDGGHPMFHVKYDDGDQEDLTTWELVECGITVPVAKPVTNVKKVASTPQTAASYPGGTQVQELLQYPAICCSSTSTSVASVITTTSKARGKTKQQQQQQQQQPQHPSSQHSSLALLALDPADYGTLVSTWMFTRRFSHLLHLSPCSLRVFEDAVVYGGSSVLLEDILMAMTRVLLDNDMRLELNDMRVPYGPRRARRSR